MTPEASALLQDLASLPDPLHLPDPPAGGEAVALRPPGSKSLTNRALPLAALASGRSRLTGALTDADDAQRMIDALRALGASIDETSPGTLIIDGVAGAFPHGGELFLNNAGTATRFLTAFACLARQPVVIDGNERMRQRPIGELVELLRAIDVDVEEIGEAGYVPLRVQPARPAGGVIEVATTLSSQYVSALLMLAPWTEHGIEVRFTDTPTSPSYVRMTVGLLERLGASSVEIEGDPPTRVFVGPGPLDACTLDVEPDASGATYFWAAGALSPGRHVTVEGIDGDSLQGDAHFVDLLERMGAHVQRGSGATTVAGPGQLRGIDADLTLMPDAAMTLAMVAAVADGPTRMRGLQTLRVKETDRIAAMQTELARVGVTVDVFQDGREEGVVIHPPSGGLGVEPVAFDTYDDHRMAMALSLLALRRTNVQIRDPGCVDKTYPGYWSDFARMWGA
jgi:3-phosphoshikimate 1-carboxyvinyltransferase